VTLAMLLLIPRRVKRVPAPLIDAADRGAAAAAVGHLFRARRGHHRVAFHATVCDHVVAAAAAAPCRCCPGTRPTGRRVLHAQLRDLQALLSGAFAVPCWAASNPAVA